MKRITKLGPCLVALTVAMGGMISSLAFADPVVHRLTLTDVSYTSAGVGGIGNVGTANIEIAGINGDVTRSYLYWHGVGLNSTVYDNPTINFNGTPVTGNLIGRAGTNCWGAGESRAYRADVTALVTGDATYTLADMASATTDSVNGASLIVVFDDGDPDSGRDLAFFEGNDSSHAEGFVGATDNWNAVLNPIQYGGGDVFAQIHVGDGQSFSGGTISFTTANGSNSIPTGTSLLAGNSVPTMGNSRASNGQLWDIHTFDITTAFGGVADNNSSLNLRLARGDDCVALIAVLLDLERGSAPPPPVEPPVEPPPPVPDVEPVPVPVNSPLGLALLMLLMLAMAGLYFRRRTY